MQPQSERLQDRGCHSGPPVPARGPHQAGRLEQRRTDTMAFSRMWKRATSIVAAVPAAALVVACSSRLVRRLALAIDRQVDTLGVEAHEASDSLGLRDRRLVAPDEIVVDLLADLHRPVRGLALERAGGLAARGPEQLRAHVLARQVVTGWQAGLVEENRPVRFGQLLAVEGDLNVLPAGGDGDLVPSSHARANRTTPARIPGSGLGTSLGAVLMMRL